MFDGFDDYSVRFHDRLFVHAENRFLTPVQLCEANPFWRAINELLHKGIDELENPPKARSFLIDEAAFPSTGPVSFAATRTVIKVLKNEGRDVSSFWTVESWARSDQLLNRSVTRPRAN